MRTALVSGRVMGHLFSRKKFVVIVSVHSWTSNDSVHNATNLEQAGETSTNLCFYDE